MSGDLRTRVEALTARIKREAQLLGGRHPIDKGARRNIGIDADRLAALVLDDGPDTPTADAPADTDLAESIKQDVQDALFALNAERQDQGWHEGMIPGVIEVSRLVSAAVLPLVRAQVEAARRDAWDEGSRATYLYERGETHPEPVNPYRAARGETRQP